MYQSIDVLRLADAAARHAGARQAVVARNMANADTPGYRAQEIPAFADVHRQSAGSLQVTRPGHLAADGPARPVAREARHGAEPSPNGNSVSIELEMVAAADISRAHRRALTVYRHALGLLRTAIQGR